MPPANICMPEERSGRRGSAARRATSEPAAQAAPETSSATAPSASIRLGPEGHASSATPPKPTSSPSNADRERPCPLATRSKSAIHSGTAAISSAAMPVSTRVSDHATSAVAAHEQEAAHDRRREPLAPPDTVARSVAAPDGPDVEQAAGDHEPDPHRQEDGDRVDRVQDPEVRRSPDDVDDRESRPDPRLATRAQLESQWFDHQPRRSRSSRSPGGSEAASGTVRRTR